MSTFTCDGDFTTMCVVDRSPEVVYAAIMNVGGWWTGAIEGRADQVGDEFRYRFGDLHDSRQRVTELVAGRRIVWEVTDAELSGRRTPDEWIGTHIVFDLAATENGTRVQFTHVGLVPDLECFEDCAYAWTFFLGSSLTTLAATGEGPTPPPWA